MARPDAAHVWTDKELAKLERRIAGVYRTARDDLQQTVTDYFEQFRKRDEQMKAEIGKVHNGKTWTEKDYRQWRMNQIARGKRYEALRDRMAERYTKANEVATAYVNDATPGIYSLNRNFSAYTIDKYTGGKLSIGPDGETLNADFILFDEQTVRRLIVEQPDVMPYYPPERAVKRGIDLAYGKQQITQHVTSGALRGLGVGQIADELQERMETMNRTSALRAARTGVTAAQNAGRLDSYRQAEEMGISLQKRWLATLDGRTRHEHRLLDGQVRDIEEPFVVPDSGETIMHPGDPSAPGRLVYNCRCRMVTYHPGANLSPGKRRAKDPDTGQYVTIEWTTYQEWEKSLKERS